MTSRDYKKRRTTLRSHLDGLGYVVAAFDAVQQTNDASAPFQQEASFWYLTGIEEPGWTLIVEKIGKSTLIAPDISEVHRIFDGGISDLDAQEISGVERVMGRKEGYAFLENILKAEPSIGGITPDPQEKHYSFVMNPAPKKLYSYLKSNSKEVVDIRLAIARMRAIKTPDEIDTIRRAVKLTIEAFSKVKQTSSTAENEYNLEAAFTFAFRNMGAHHAYEPIIAAGKNACTLHYQKNSTELPKNGLVLMDVGARTEGYCADITRTYAIGTPTPRQIAVHASVEKAHHQIIALLRPGVSVKEYHLKVDEIMKSALKDLGLLKKPEDYRKYFPHAISHGLGIDVHDSLGAPEVFEPGMVLTVEPGIYISEEGIGVRIEDDILITTTGNENLSASLPTAL